MKAAGLQSGEAKWGMPEPHRLDTISAQQSVFVGRTLVDIHKLIAVITHLHLTGQESKVRKGTEIAPT